MTSKTEATKIYRIKAKFEPEEGAAGHYTFMADFEGEPREHSISALDECIVGYDETFGELRTNVNLRDW